MAVYRFCILDEADRIQAVQERNFAHDKQATDHAAAIVAGHGADRMQIWRATRLVEHYGAKSPLPHDPRTLDR